MYSWSGIAGVRSGRLDTLDLNVITTFTPNVFENINKCGLNDYVFPSLSQVSYTWQLMKKIELTTKNSVCEPIYDFVFLDGAHIWETDSSAFYLATKLLKPGGWILFDDVMWTIEGSPYGRSLPEYQNVPDDFRTISHVERIVELLVKQCPDYEEMFRRDNWAWARKKIGAGEPPNYVHLDRFYFKQILKQKFQMLLKSKRD